MKFDKVTSLENQELSSGSVIPKNYKVFYPGTLSVKNNAFRKKLAGNYTITGFGGNVSVAPVGNSIVVNVKKNDTQIATLTVAAGQTLIDDGSFTSEQVSSGDLLVFDIVQTGSSVAGENLNIEYSIN